jgi:hypothetical protein
MNKPDLARLYRRFTRATSTTSVSHDDVDALIALAEGHHTADTERLLAEVSRSGAHADLLRFTRALQPESARLGAELETAFEAPLTTHRRTAHAARQSMPQRALRFVSAMAACMIAAVAVWNYQRAHVAMPVAPVATLAGKAAQPDRIFAAMGGDVNRAQKTDQIFRGGFMPDRIFRTTDG